MKGAVCLLCMFPFVFASVITVTENSMTRGPTYIMPQGIIGTIGGQGGNSSEMNLSQATESVQWQGIFGNLQFNILLQDANGNVMYNWSTVNVTGGEIYFSIHSNINFAQIEDPNSSFTVIVQTNYNMANTTSSDNLTSTMVEGNHSTFEVGEIEIVSPTPRAITNNYTMSPVFETVLLRESGMERDVYAAIIKADSRAFNNAIVDFQAYLPMNTSTSSAIYYVYTELE